MQIGLHGLWLLSLDITKPANSRAPLTRSEFGVALRSVRLK